MALITYADKSTMNVNSNVPNTNKGRADDWNEIKSVVNGNWKQKDIITIKLDSDFTISSTNTITQITGFSVEEQIGNNLSLASDKIVIGAGVKKVLVSYTAKHLNTTSTTRSFSYLQLNGTSCSQEAAFFPATNSQITVSLQPQLFQVQQNDSFSLVVYGQQGNKIGGAAAWRITSMTVEVVQYSDK